MKHANDVTVDLVILVQELGHSYFCLLRLPGSLKEESREVIFSSGSLESLQ